MVKKNAEPKDAPEPKTVTVVGDPVEVPRPVVEPPEPKTKKPTVLECADASNSGCIRAAMLTLLDELGVEGKIPVMMAHFEPEGDTRWERVAEGEVLGAQVALLQRYESEDEQQQAARKQGGGVPVVIVQPADGKPVEPKLMASWLNMRLASGLGRCVVLTDAQADAVKEALA